MYTSILLQDKTNSYCGLDRQNAIIANAKIMKDQLFFKYTELINEDGLLFFDDSSFDVMKSLYQNLLMEKIHCDLIVFGVDQNLENDKFEFIGYDISGKSHAHSFLVYPNELNFLKNFGCLNEYGLFFDVTIAEKYIKYIERLIDRGITFEFDVDVIPIPIFRYRIENIE